MNILYICNEYIVGRYLDFLPQKRISFSYTNPKTRGYLFIPT